MFALHIDDETAINIPNIIDGMYQGKLRSLKYNG